MIQSAKTISGGEKIESDPTTNKFDGKAMSEDQYATFDGQSADQFKASSQECWDSMNAVLDTLSKRSDKQAGIRQLSNVDDMVTELNAIATDSPKMANLVLYASLAVLVNTQTIKNLDAVLIRRASEGN